MKQPGVPRQKPGLGPVHPQVKSTGRTPANRDPRPDEKPTAGWLCHEKAREGGSRGALGRGAPRDGSPLRCPHHKGSAARSARGLWRGRSQGGRLLSRLRKLGWKGPAEQGSVRATEGSGAGKGEGLLISGKVLPTLQQATRVIVTQGLPSLPEGLKVHAEAAQELGAGINLRRRQSVKAICVRGTRLMRAPNCLAKRSSWSLRGLSRRR